MVKEPSKEFEEHEEHDEEDQGILNLDDEPEETEIIIDPISSNGTDSGMLHLKTNALKSRRHQMEQEAEGHPWLSTSQPPSKGALIAKTSEIVEAYQEPSSPPNEFLEKAKLPIISRSKGVTDITKSEDEVEFDASFEGFSSGPWYLQNDQATLMHQAFAADDLVEESFVAEKTTLVAEEDPFKPIVTAIPGWGSWVGPGLSRKDKRQAKKARTTNGLASNRRLAHKHEGVPPDKRKDRNLDRVIISERRLHKPAKYFASSLPHPFESRAQYERSLRLPMGPEFTTKETFQGMTKPRVIMKGGVIAPMRKPLI